MEADAACIFADLGAIRQRLIDAVDRILLHCQKKAAAHLGSGTTRIKQGRRGVNQLLGGKEIIGLYDLLHRLCLLTWICSNLGQGPFPP